MSYAPDLNWAISKKYAELSQGSMYQAEYVWIGGTGLDIRTKTRTLTEEPTEIKDFPNWNFDGSSTRQAPTQDSEVELVPVAFYPDPFRPQKGNYLVLCECVKPDAAHTPITTNTRNHCAKVMKQAESSVPWFGLEQEYTLFDKDGITPLGWPKFGYPGAQGPYYCSVGTRNAYGRQIVEAHYRACMYAGIKICGSNAEVMPGQWEYQIGPAVGIDAADMLIISRYILDRVCEEFQVIVSFDPKPIAGDWNGAGCHTNFSTKAMREEGGFEHIEEAVRRLERRHLEHINVYGAGNERRLTGQHETAPIDKFTAGVANRGASIRIPRQTANEGKGYLEDRRPASNVDPYLVTCKLVETIVLGL